MAASTRGGQHDDGGGGGGQQQGGDGTEAPVVLPVALIAKLQHARAPLQRLDVSGLWLVSLDGLPPGLRAFAYCHGGDDVAPLAPLVAGSASTLAELRLGGTQLRNYGALATLTSLATLDLSHSDLYDEDEGMVRGLASALLKLSALQVRAHRGLWGFPGVQVSHHLSTALQVSAHASLGPLAVRGAVLLRNGSPASSLQSPRKASCLEPGLDRAASVTLAAAALTPIPALWPPHTRRSTSTCLATAWTKSLRCPDSEKPCLGRLRADVTLPAPAAALIPAVRPLPTTQHLDLSGNRLDDKFALVAPSLAALTHLRHLDLMENLLYVDGAAQLASALRVRGAATGASAVLQVVHARA
jgi:hypothetical protein